MRPFRIFHKAGAALALLVSCLPLGLGAQVSPYEIVVENDHFTYWLPSDQRPDREYTSGVISRVPLRQPVPLLRAVAEGAAPCTGREFSDEGCTTTSLRLGQKIYTPTPWRPEPGERPYAGWLFAGITVDRATETRQRTIDLEVGVTGRPSLGEAVQTAVHQRMGHGSPHGWGEQIAFEPAFVLRVAENRMLLETPQGTPVGARVSGGIGAAFGTLRTAADAALEVRAGLRPPHPWRTGAGTRGNRLAVYGVAGIAQHLVLRNLMLDGSLFRAGPGVERRSSVSEWTAGAGVRLGRVGVEYRGVVRGREYKTQGEAHRWGSAAVSVAR
jgi:lipid A 3-O-deacylase